jgi:hypothetical protein
MIAGLAYLIYTKLIAPKALAKSAPTQGQPDNSGQPWQDNSGGQWHPQDNSGQPNTMSQLPTNSIAGGPEMSQPGGWSGVTGDPSSGGWNGVTSPSSPPAPPSLNAHPDELFFIARAGRRRQFSESQRPPPPGHQYSNQSPPSTHMPAPSGQYAMPRRAMSPRAFSDQPEMDPFADQRGRGAGSPQSELSTSGAMTGYESGGVERFEAPERGGAYFDSAEMEGRQRFEAPGSRY